MSIWYSETENDSIRFSLKISETLHSEQSEFQLVEVVQTEAYGRMLVLDGCVMTTEQDEFVYHEMISHIPMCYHDNPKDVVVIGGGDGGTVREILRHPSVEKVTLCEIDRVVVDVSKKYLPSIAGKLDDPRVEVRIGDGVAYIQELAAAADLIIIDSTDPIGPGEGLFSGAFYQNVAKALKPGGIMVAQSESPWHSAQSLQRIRNNVNKGFRYQWSYMGAIPTYPRGCWSWTMAANHELPIGQINEQRLKGLGKMRYLNAAVANAAFALPEMFKEKLLG